MLWNVLLSDCVERFVVSRSDTLFVVTLISSRIESSDVSHTYSASHIAGARVVEESIDGI